MDMILGHDLGAWERKNKLEANDTYFFGMGNYGIFRSIIKEQHPKGLLAIK